MVLFKKGLARQAKRSNITSFQARRIKSALHIIQNTPVDQLTQLERVKRINVPNRDDIYVYRVDMRNRIVLSIDKNQDTAIVQSIVNADSLNV